MHAVPAPGSVHADHGSYPSERPGLNRLDRDHFRARLGELECPHLDPSVCVAQVHGVLEYLRLMFGGDHDP